MSVIKIWLLEIELKPDLNLEESYWSDGECVGPISSVFIVWMEYLQVENTEIWSSYIKLWQD